MGNGGSHDNLWRLSNASIAWYRWKLILHTVKGTTVGKWNGYTVITSNYLFRGRWAQMGKFAAQHSNAKTVNHFKGKFDLTKSTIQHFRQQYLQELGKQARAGDTSGVVMALLTWCSLLLSAAEGCIMQYDKMVLVQYSGHGANTWLCTVTCIKVGEA